MQSIPTRSRAVSRGRSLPRPALLVAAAVVLAGCDSATEPGFGLSGVITDLVAVAHAGEGDAFVATGLRFHVDNGFSVAGSDSAVIYRSDDGRAWERVPLDLPGDLADVAHGDGRWVAVGRGVWPDQHGVILTSEDGLTWDAVSGAPEARWSGVAYGDGRFVITGWDPYSDFEVMATSADGDEWAVAGYTQLRSSRLAFADSLFVLYGQAGWLAVSADGQEWDSWSVEPMNQVTAVGHGPDGWLAFGLYDCCFGQVPAEIVFYRATSGDGGAWTVAHQPGRVFVSSIAGGDDAWVAVGAGVFFRSDDGLTWTQTAEREARYPALIALRVGDLFIGVGRDATWWSADGTTWTRTLLHGEASAVALSP